MKSLLFKIILLLCVSCMSLVAFVTLTFGGHTDPFYVRLTTPKTSSMIIGTSRAAQGIQPAVFNNSELDFARPIVNFAFTVGHSPFGEVYSSLIKKKLIETTEVGLFIIEVSPWSITNWYRKSTLSGENLIETMTFMSNIHRVDVKPNLEYIFFYYEEPLYKGAVPNKNMFLHEDGWLEITIPMDNLTVSSRIKAKVKAYEDYASTSSLSYYRLNALKELVQYLSARGKVYLVRMAVAPEIYEVEKEYMSNFDEMMTVMARETGTQYINMILESDHYRTTDGNHLWKESGLLFTQQLIERIALSNKSIPIASTIYLDR